MAWKLTKTQPMPVGIDVGNSAVKLAQLRCTADELELSAVAMAETPEECGEDRPARLASLAKTLSRLFREGRFKGKECVLSLPATETFVQHVRIAKLPREELERALWAELQGKLPFDPADAVMRHVVAGETYSDGETGLEVIVLAAAREVIEGYVDAARKARLRVQAVNVEPCAILECFARLFQREADKDKATLFLDMGRAMTQVVVAHGPKLVFARNVPLGGKHLERAAGAILGMPMEEIQNVRLAEALSKAPVEEADRLYDAMGPALASMGDEISRSLRYYESVFPSKLVERAVFLGGQALDRRFCQRMAQRLNLPAQIGDPLARIRSAESAEAAYQLDRRHPQPAWAVAVGLSLGAKLSGAA